MSMTAHGITPCLWFDTQAEEAAKFYASVFKDAKIGKTSRYGKEGVEVHGKQPGTVMTVAFEIAGQKFLALNGGPHFKPNEAVSFMISTEDQAETDRLWDAIVGNGGEESMCGWCKDKWGFSWQITPKRLMQLMTDPDPDRARRASQAMLKMHRIDIAAIEAAAGGN